MIVEQLDTKLFAIFIMCQFDFTVSVVRAVDKRKCLVIVFLISY